MQAETQETWAQSLGQEDPLKEEMATHSSILAWRIPWTEEPGGPLSVGCKESDMTEWLTLSLFSFSESQEFSGGLVFRTPGFHWCGWGSIPGRGTEILQIT